MLSGCATSGSRFAAPTYPELPADLQVCFDSEVPAPSGALSKKQVIDLVAALKLSEVEKVACGKRLIAFYEDLSN